MDSRSNFIEEFKKFIISCDEDFIVDFANKGLYKRAIKELDKGISVDVEINDHNVVCTLDDGTKCELSQEISEFKCSCPSRKVCKHVTTSILYIQNNLGEIFGEDQQDACGDDGQAKGDLKEQGSGRENTELSHDKCGVEVGHNLCNGGSVSTGVDKPRGDFSWVEEIDINEVVKNITQKQLKEIIFAYEFGHEFEIKEEAYLIVELKDRAVRVRIHEKPSLDNILCSCKEKGFCTHKAEAIILYKIQKGKLNLEDLQSCIEVNIPHEVLQEVRELIKEITVLGLSRLPVSTLERIENKAVICHSADLPRIEKMLRSLKMQLERYFTKHASFSKKAVISIMSKVYASTKAIENCNSLTVVESLKGEHKTSYTKIPPIKLIGMGAGAWASDSGYEGITYYFFNEKRKLWMTYTDMKPNYYEGSNINFKSMYEGKSIWNLDSDLKSISRMNIRLLDCKINKSLRISSSSETTGDFIGNTNVNEIDFGHKKYDDWSVLINDIKEHFYYSLVSENEKHNIVLLNISSWGKSSFDEIEQVFKMPVLDKVGRELNILLRFRGENQYLIRKLEKFESRKTLSNLLLAKIFKVKGEYCLQPITMYLEDGGDYNLTLDM